MKMVPLLGWTANLKGLRNPKARKPRAQIARLLPEALV
jgi:hypothetical protein